MTYNNYTAVQASPCIHLNFTGAAGGVPSQISISGHCERVDYPDYPILLNPTLSGELDFDADFDIYELFGLPEETIIEKVCYYPSLIDAKDYFYPEDMDRRYNPYVFFAFMFKCIDSNKQIHTCPEPNTFRYNATYTKYTNGATDFSYTYNNRGIHDIIDKIAAPFTYTGLFLEDGRFGGNATSNVYFAVDEDAAAAYLQSEDPGPGPGPGPGPDPGDDVPDPHLESPLGMVFRANLAQMNSFADTLYTNDYDGMWQSIKRGLEAYGQNPIDMVIAAMYVPFDVSKFCTVGDLHRIPFGSYSTPDAQAYLISNISKQVTMATGTFAYKFGDFRERSISAKLYLPYVGIVPLCWEEVVGKSYTLKCNFDVFTGQIKYYLIINNITYSTWEGQIGVKLALSATANNKGFELIKDIGNVVTAAATGNILGTVAGIGGLATDVAQAPDKSVRGNNSQSTDIWDYMKPVLFIGYPDFIIPDRSILGKPSDIWTTIGSNTGYIEATDFELTIPSATDTELEMIESLLTQGVYV